MSPFIRQGKLHHIVCQPVRSRFLFLHNFVATLLEEWPRCDADRHIRQKHRCSYSVPASDSRHARNTSRPAVSSHLLSFIEIRYDSLNVQLCRRHNISFYLPRS